MRRRDRRIAFLVPSLGEREGQGSVDLALLRQVADAGYEVTVYAGNAAEVAEELEGVRVKRIPRLPAWQFGNLMLSLLTTTPRLRRWRYRLVHADPAVAFRRADVMVCHTVSGVWRTLPEEVWREPGVRGRHADAATRFKAWLERRQLRKARLVLVASRRTQLDLIERGVRPERIRYLPFGVDPERFRPPTKAEREAARAVLGISEAAFTILTVGPHGPRKGLPLVLDAMGMSQTHEVLLAPGDRRGDAWVEEAEERGLPMIAPGKLDDVRIAYWASDLLVHPSRYDAFGMAVLEAMACGLPVVVSRDAGAHEIVRDAGIVLTEHSSEALRGAIDVLRRDPSRRARMGRRGREIALHRTWDEAGQVLLQSYEEVAENI
ncbi:MAG: glycosyltransferase family 4 protein [Actinomycetota bacterium]